MPSVNSPTARITSDLLEKHLEEIVEFGSLMRNQWLYSQGIRPGDGESDETVLMVACALNNDPKCAKFWLSKCDDADLQVTDKKGRPLLLLANNPAVARMLLDRGADITHAMPDGDCVFIHYGSFHVEMFQELGRRFVEKGGAINFRGAGGRSPM